MLEGDDPRGGAFALFLRDVPTSGHLDSLCVPNPGNLPIFLKKCLCLGVSQEGEERRWALLELTDALNYYQLHFMINYKQVHPIHIWH